MKKSKNLILSVLLAVCAFCLCFALVGCGKKDKDETPKYSYGEEGFYYYDGADSSRYMLSLQSGTYLMTVNGASAYSGSYSYDEESGKVSFTGDNEFAATLGESALSLSVEGSGYSFKAYKFFNVTYVDENGVAIATESVLNGQTAEALDIEKDGYWFIDWYADSSNSAVYSFDTSIAGDTTIYGWFIEKNPTAVEHTVTWDYGDGVTEVSSTQNGAVWSLPASCDGKEIAGWWVSATNKEAELTYKYTAGDVFAADTTLFAVYSSSSILASSVTEDGITWDVANAGSNVTITVYNSNGKQVVSGTATSSAGVYTSSAFSALEAGTYTVEITSGNITETRVYVVHGLARVSLSSADIIVNGSGRVISFAPVDGAEGYKITVTNGEKTMTEDLGNHTYYNFSDWEMTAEGITFVVTAYADGYADSVSDGFTYLLVLGNVTVDISDDTVSWNHVDGALEYVVTITDVDGNVIDSFRTSDTSFSLKYYENGTYDITVQPHTDGYYSEAKTVYGYAKDSLMAPQITDVTKYTVSWEPVVDADSYVVLINGVEYTTADTKLIFSESNVPTTASSYEISVKAVENGGSDSPYSDVVVATEEFSSAVSYDKNTIYWNYDIAAAYYGVSVNGAEETKTEGGHSFKVTLTKAGDNVITVTAYDENDASLGSAEITVYAYSVILDPNGASLLNAAADENNTIYVAQGDELNLGIVEKTYADFVGWYTQADYTEGQSDEYEGKGSLVEDGSTFTGNGSMYLYAYWTYQYIDVTLYVDEAEYATVQIKYNNTSYKLPVPGSASVTDDFVGWYTSSSSGEQYTNETGASTGIAYSNITELYAHYLTTRSYTRTSYNGETVYAVTATSEASGLVEMTIPEKYTTGGVEYNLVLNASALSNCVLLEVLNIPDTVMYVSITNDGYRKGTGAFASCPNLKEVNVYATGIEADASKEPRYFSENGVLFHKMDSSDDVELVYYPYGRGLSSYEIPATVSNEYECEWDGTPVTHNVTTIPSQVFRDRKLRDVTMPSTVTLIETQAFYSNTSLKTVTFEAGGTAALTIEDQAFKSCTAITEITLPSRYSAFNADAFSDCTSLMNINIENGGVYMSDGGVLLDSAGTELLYVPLGRSGDIVISELTSKNLAKIGDDAFASNTKITSVTVSAAITEIGESAFDGCRGITSVTFLGTANNSDLTIRTRAFYGCILLPSVSLPANLTVMEENAFGGCTNLQYVYFDARPNSSTASLKFAAGSFGTTNYISTLELGANVPAIEFADIFDGGRLANVIIDANNQAMVSESLDDGAYSAVYNKDKSTILYYPLNRVGEYHVDSATSSIDSNVFAGRVGLTNLYLGANVNTIGTDAFAGCTYLENIYVDDTNSNFGNAYDEEGKADGILYKKEEGQIVELIYCPLATTMTSLTVGGTVVRTSGYAFSENTAVTSVEFTSTTFELGKYTFYKCTNLVTVTLPDSMTNISEGAFYQCTKLTNFVMPTSVKTIDDYAFYLCTAMIGDLNDVTNGTTLPEGLEVIGKHAFDIYQMEVKSGGMVATSGDIQMYPSIGGVIGGSSDTDSDTKKLAMTIPSTVYLIDEYAFYGCWNNSAVTAGIVFAETPEGETAVDLEIGSYAFSRTQYARSLEIPARVTTIGSYAFAYFGYSASDSETTITFEDGSKLTEIKTGTFQYAKYLKEITLPETITTIGTNAFEHCDNLATVNFAPEGKTSQLTSLGSAFTYSGLVSIEIPAAITTIATGTFLSLSNLTTVTFEEGSQLASIGDSAFMMSGLTEIELPASLSSVGMQTFRECASLTSVSFQGDGEVSSLTSLGDKMFYACSALTTVNLPGNLTGMSGDSTFARCTSLASIEIPAGVTNISEYAFDRCTSLTTITFDTDNSGLCSLSQIGDCAFVSCESLTSFTFPKTTAATIYLGTNLFGDGYSTDTYGDSAVASLTINAKVTNIGGALYGLEALTSITVSEGCGYKVDSSKQVLYSEDEKAIEYVIAKITATEITIPEGIETIDDNSFMGQTAIQKVAIGKDVSYIGEYAFNGCTALTTVTFADGTAMAHGTLCADAFSDCTSLTSINLPEGLTEIPDSCFDGCTALSQITIPTTVTRIGTWAFWSTAITSIDLSHVVNVDNYAFRLAASLQTVTFGSSIVSIGSYAFYGCISLTSVSIPNGLTTISSYTFYSCTSLASVDIPDSVDTIDTYAFYGCTGLTEVVLPSNLRTIGTDVFEGCSNLATCVLPEGLETLGSKAFYGCSSLTEAIFPKTLTSVGGSCYYNCSKLEILEMNNALESIGSSAFYNCTSLEYVSVPRGVTSLGSSAFYGCTSLVYAYTGASVTDLSGSTFYGCTSLETVEFGPALKSLGGSDFYNCTSLTEIELGNGLNSIGSSTFYGCTSITTMIIPSSVSSVGSSAFSGCTLTLYIESSVNYVSTYWGSSWSTDFAGETYYFSLVEPDLNEDGTAYDGNFWLYDANDNPFVWVYVPDVDATSKN